jgi:hypothetical protein
MSPVSFSTIAELVSEARAHLVFIRTLDHAPARDSLEAERRQVNRRAGTGQNQLGHRRANGRRGRSTLVKTGQAIPVFYDAGFDGKISARR